MKHIVVLNLTGDRLDSSFSLVAEMKGATISQGWKDGAPPSVSNPVNPILTQKVAIPAISNLLAESLQGFSPEQLISLEFVVVGGNEELKHWLAYLCGRWNIALTFWHERSRNLWASEQIKPGDDPLFLIPNLSN
jgi:hypothetical protein